MSLVCLGVRYDILMGSFVIAMRVFESNIYVGLCLADDRLRTEIIILDNVESRIISIVD